MKNNSRASKGLVLVLALVMLVSVAIGGTIAWLLDKTDPIVNTFTPTTLNIELEEEEAGEDREGSFQIIPGENIKKTPVVTGTFNVDCYMFVEVEEVGFDLLNTAEKTLLDYEVDLGNWTPVPGENNVYYRVEEATPGITDSSIRTVLVDDTVTVSKDITLEDMAKLEGKEVSLTFTAYIIQKDGFDSVEDAWAEASK